MRSERFDFPGAHGHVLAGRLELPDGPSRATALFAHCFTCGKDVFAATRIARALTDRGIAVLRFDFTGLGASDGEFANTTFSSNVGDLVAAARALADAGRPVDLLLGHSLGGAAVLAAAGDIAEARAVATIAAPSDPHHVTHLFRESVPAIEAAGEAEVQIAGRPFRIRKEFLDDVAEQRLADRIARLGRPLLLFHAPLDQTVGIENAGAIFQAAKHPKSFVSLDGADHLVSRREDAARIARIVAAWVESYVPAAAEAAPAVALPAGTVRVAETRTARYQCEVLAGPHRLLADEPASVGGTDTGPNPYDLLLASLGSCTAMTLRMYADRKGWPLERATVDLRHSKVHAADCADCETREGKVDVIERAIRLDGPLDDEQRARLLEIADMCPVHRTLHGEIVVRTRLEG
jgi:uncharacterized OsmC-like protein/fermentation-respiration switch protein FrsA (DUF1100 family)